MEQERVWDRGVFVGTRLFMLKEIMFHLRDIWTWRWSDAELWRFFYTYDWRRIMWLSSYDRVVRM